MYLLALSALAMTLLLVVLVHRRRTETVRALVAGLRLPVRPGVARPGGVRRVEPVPEERGRPAAVWTERRSPYAAPRTSAGRISLPDDAADLAIGWRADDPAHGIPGLSPAPEDDLA